MTILGLADEDSGENHGQGRTTSDRTWRIERILVVRDVALVMFILDERLPDERAVYAYRHCQNESQWRRRFVSDTTVGATKGYLRMVPHIGFDDEPGPVAHFPGTEQGWYDAIQFAHTIGTA